jgi:hypothetical protein
MPVVLPWRLLRRPQGDRWIPCASATRRCGLRGLASALRRMQRHGDARRMATFIALRHQVAADWLERPVRPGQDIGRHCGSAEEATVGVGIDNGKSIL